MHALSFTETGIIGQPKATCHAKALPCINIQYIQYSNYSVLLYPFFSISICKSQSLEPSSMVGHPSHQWPPTKSLGSHPAVSAPKADQNTASEVQPAQPHSFRRVSQDFLLNTQREWRLLTPSVCLFSSSKRCLCISVCLEFETLGHILPGPM